MTNLSNKVADLELKEERSRLLINRLQKHLKNQGYNDYEMDCLAKGDSDSADERMEQTNVQLQKTVEKLKLQNGILVEDLKVQKDYLADENTSLSEYLKKIGYSQYEIDNIAQGNNSSVPNRLDIKRLKDEIYMLADEARQMSELLKRLHSLGTIDLDSEFLGFVNDTEYGVGIPESYYGAV